MSPKDERGLETLGILHLDVDSSYLGAESGSEWFGRSPIKVARELGFKFLLESRPGYSLLSSTRGFQADLVTSV